MIPGWEDLTESLSVARDEISAEAPDASAAAEGEAYLLRVLTSTLAESSIAHLLTPHGLMQVLPTRGFSNPDYLMLTAGLDPSRSYRIAGRLNDSERTGIGVNSVRGDGAVILEGYADFDSDNTDDEGAFSLDIGPDAAGAGTLALTSDTRILIVRTLHRNDGTPAHLTLTGNPPQSEFSLTTGSAEGALRHAGQMTLRHVRQFLEWSRATRKNPNVFTRPPPELGAAVQGVPHTCYFLGYYALMPAEWLEVVMPANMQGYWSLHAGNHWMETLPGGVHDLNAIPDPDGRTRVRIGSSVPKHLPNGIDTLGRRRGVLICRMTAALDTAIPETRLRQAEN